MSNITLTFAYLAPSKFGESPTMQYSFINPVTFKPLGDSTIAKIFAQQALNHNYQELQNFAAALYNSSDATVTVDDSLIPELLKVADVFHLDSWIQAILVGIINKK